MENIYPLCGFCRSTDLTTEESNRPLPRVAKGHPISTGTIGSNNSSSMQATVEYELELGLQTVAVEARTFQTRKQRQVGNYVVIDDLPANLYFVGVPKYGHAQEGLSILVNCTLCLGSNVVVKMQTVQHFDIYMLLLCMRP